MRVWESEVYVESDGATRLYDMRPLRPGEVENLAKDSSVLVVQVAGCHTGTARPEVVLVLKVRERYARALHLYDLHHYLRECHSMNSVPRSP